MPLKNTKAVAWSHDERYAYLLGTGMSGEEGLVVFQDPLAIDTTTE